jgi:aminopeptidase N
VGFAERVTESFASTPRMIEHFERLFDEPYPWDKYAQLLVRNFAAGAMENTSATTFNQGLGLSGHVDGVIAHELVHQWMGDLVAYKSWEHLWLGEGWATYGEALWAEAEAGPDEARDAYYRVMYSQLGATRSNDTYAPRFPGLASKFYVDPDQNFYKPNNPYTKGALVLHMLRTRLGDEVFFDGVADYIDRYKFRTVETDDFRRVLEEASGQSLERFFRQWVIQPGMPRVSVELGWDEPASALTVRAEQTQRIDADNPAYAFVLPIYVTLEDGDGRYLYLPMETRSVERSFALPARPVEADVDPNLRVAAHTRVTKPLAMWLRQIEHGPTIVARARAAEALGALDDPLARAAIERARVADPLLGALADARAGHGLDSALARTEEDRP